jgi:hypothetical protein
MRLFRIAVIVCLLAGSAMLALPAPASAAAAVLTVQPSSDLVDGTVLTIHGTGFPPSSSLFACEGIVDATPDFRDCGRGIPFTTDVNGSFTTQYAVRRFITPVDTGVMVDCADPSNTCGIGAQVTADLNGPSVIVTLGFRAQTIVPRPDLMVRNRATGVLYGDNVYSTTGNGIQTRNHVLVDGEWTYAVVVQNDGNETDDLVVSAPVQNGVGVDYFDGYFNVTAQVNGGGLTLRVAPGQTITLAVRGRALPGPAGLYAVIVSVHSVAAFELTDVLQLQYVVPSS